MNVLDLHAHKLSTSKKYDLQQKILRAWMPLLTPEQFMVLLFIFDRTYGWGKTTEYIKMAHFCTGVQGSFNGTGMSKRAVYRALEALREAGVVQSKSDGRGVYYSINERWEAGMLRTPKRLKAGNSSTEKGTEKLTKKCHIRHTRSATSGTPIYKTKHDKKEHGNQAAAAALRTPKEKSKKKSSRAGTSAAGAMAALGEEVPFAEKLKAARAASAVATDKAMLRAKKTQSVLALEKLWQAAVRKQFPEASLVAWPKSAAMKVAGFKKQWQSQVIYRKDKGCTAWDFFAFAIANWRRIRQLKFNWMKDVQAPEYPDVEFLIGFKKHFIAAMDEEGFEQRRMKLTARDRLYQKLIREGYTPEDAEREADKDDAAHRAIQREQEITKQAHAEQRGIQRQLLLAEKEKRSLQIENEKLEEKLRKGGRVKEAPEQSPMKLVEGAFGKWKDEDFGIK